MSTLKLTAPLQGSLREAEASKERIKPGVGGKTGVASLQNTAYCSTSKEQFMMKDAVPGAIAATSDSSGANQCCDHCKPDPSCRCYDFPTCNCRCYCAASYSNFGDNAEVISRFIHGN